MRVIILGSGQVGQHVLQPVRALPSVTSIVIADRDGQRAQQIAASAGDARVGAAQIDATEPVALRTLLRDGDVVVATIGPYYRFGTLVLQAAIDTGCHYIDVCDDPEPTMAMLQLHAAAEQAGISAVVGAGASPGIANLLAATAIGELDRVDSLLTIWGATERVSDSDDIRGAHAALEHWLEQCSGKIPVFANGALGFHPPLQSLAFDYPGFGRIEGVTVGHPEPVTLPRSFPHIRNSYNVMNMPEVVVTILRDLAAQIDAGALTVKQAAVCLEQQFTTEQNLGSSLATREGLRMLWSTVHEIVVPKRYLPVELAALAIGLRNGIPASVGAMLTGSIAGGTGRTTAIPAAVMATLVLEGVIQRRGVFAPEGAISPDLFFARLAPFMGRVNEQASPVRITIATGTPPIAPLTIALGTQGQPPTQALARRSIVRSH